MEPVKPPLDIATLKLKANEFLLYIKDMSFPALFGASDGKAVGTYVEHRFHEFLQMTNTYNAGNSASGIDFPDLPVDLKVTSIRQPQSSCPFSSAHQKVYGIGYHLLIFVYDKQDDPRLETTRLNFHHAIFVDKNHTADYQTTKTLLSLLDNDANKDDLIACLEEKNLPLDEIGKELLAEKILGNRPRQGYLTISNALQWRLQYGRIVDIATNGGNEGVTNLIYDQIS